MTGAFMRDTFIATVHEAAKKDDRIVFVSADFGAPALDALRRDVPDRFVFAGIAEQNMVDLGAGLALSGKTVFLYAMAPFITARCYEQTKSVLVSMRLPVTLVAVGVGLGYDHATLTHFTPEDIASMRALNGIEVLTPCDAESAVTMAREAVARPRLRYIRLDRQQMPTVYPQGLGEDWNRGFREVAKGRDVAIVACGYLTHRALRAAKELTEMGMSAGAIDLFRLKPLDAKALIARLAAYRAVVTIEEHILDGGFGSVVAEALSDAGAARPIRRLGMNDGFEVVNGTRDELHAKYGIDVKSVVAAAAELARR